MQTINEHYTEDHERLDELFFQFKKLKSSDQARAKNNFAQFKSGLE